MTTTGAPRGTLGRGGLDVGQGTALYVAAVLGTGMLVLPGLAIGVAGPAALVAVGALLLLSVPLALTFAELGARHPDAGGVSTFVARAFGPRASAVTAWWFYLGVPLGVPALGLFAGAYVEAAVGGGTGSRIATALVLIAASAAMNAYGVRVYGRVQLVLSGVLVAGLVGSALAASPDIDAANLTPLAPNGWDAVAPAALLLVWSLTGWEAATHLAGEFHDPRRDIRRATLLALGVVAVVFLLVTFTLVTVLGPAAGESAAPVTDLLATRLGPAAGGIAAALAVLVTLGNSNAYLAGLAKLGAAMGRDGSAPAWLARGAAVGDIPRRSLAVVTAQALVSLAVVAAAGWSTEHLVLVTTASQVAVYAIGLAAALRLLPSRSSGWWAAAVALAAVGALVVLSGWYLVAPTVLAVVALAHRGRRTAVRSVRGPLPASGLPRN